MSHAGTVLVQPQATDVTFWRVQLGLVSSSRRLNCSKMPIAMTERQRHELDVLGYTVLENFLAGDALEHTVASLDRLRDTEARNSRGCCALDETFRGLMDNERVLELVVDAIGWNIQMRDCIFVCTEPALSPPRRDTLGFPWHFDQVGLFAGLTHDGVMPLVDLKVSWYLSDHLEEGHGCTLGALPR